MANALDLYGITISIDPITGVKTIAGWGKGSYMLFTWDAGSNITTQTVSDQAQAILILQEATAHTTPLTLINASLEQS